MKRTSSLLKSGISLSVLTLLSRILGLIREMTKSAFLGTGSLADAFTVAFMIPNLLRRIFAENSMTVAFIPTFQTYLEQEKNGSESAKADMKEFLSATFTMLSFAVTGTVMIGILISSVIIAVFFPKIGDFSATVLLTRIMFPYLLLISIAAFFQGILNGVRIFLPTGITPILFNLSVIGCTFALAKPLGNPALAMAAGVVIGGSLQMLFQLPFVLRAGFSFRVLPFKRCFGNAGARKILTLIVPTLIGTAVYQINDLVSTALATYAGVGIAASLQYSIRLQELILGIFAVSVGTVILPDLSAHAVNKQWDVFQKLLLNAAKIIALVTIPATLFLLCSGEQVIILVYKSRRFTDESVLLTLQAFRWHIAGLFFIALNRILTSAFYAQSNPKYPTIAGIICFGINIVLAAALAGIMKGGGIALALSLASMVNTVLLLVLLKKSKTMDIPGFLAPAAQFTLKITLFSLAAAAPLYFFGARLYTPLAAYPRIIAQGLPLCMSAALFALIVLTLLMISGDEFIKNAAKKIRRQR
ncbi:murein biosynthesis integral membrane protein MurJ [Treponema sp.]|uniref:murein biosynthesis integral membrane protein MurJ n=1 Tax=Treponema sp. TaxID=166 RepID=UPI003FA226D9